MIKFIWSNQVLMYTVGWLVHCGFVLFGMLHLFDKKVEELYGQVYHFMFALTHLY